MDYILPDLGLLEIKSTISDEGKTGSFIVEPLLPGYGVTIGNSLRRILLSSLEGYAVKSVKIEGVDHEYSAMKGMKEDIVDLILNLKMARFKLNDADSAKLELSVKGPKEVTVDDFKKTSDVEIVSPGHYLCSLEKGGKLDLVVEIDKGRGYMPVEKKIEEKLPIGTIMVDSIYTPVKKVKFDVENARVGGMTNYNKLLIEITTDGSVAPQDALKTACQIMVEHMNVVTEAMSAIKPVAEKKVKAKTTKKKA
jgi:DNA-directed RNA polymerase subunit alpha